MKRLIKDESYESPCMEIVTVSVEQGFALSKDGFNSTTEDLNEFEEMEW